MRLAFPHSPFIPHLKGFIDPKWKIPLGMAVGLHIVVLASAIFLPSLMPHRPILPEIYSVDLVNEADLKPRPVSKAPPPPPPAKAAAKTMETPAVPPEVKSIAPEESLEEPPAMPTVPDKVISLRPRKRKIKKESVEEKNRLQEIKINQALARLKAKQNLHKAQAEAKQATRKALAQLQQSLLADAASSNATPQAATAPSQPETAVGKGTSQVPAATAAGSGSASNDLLGQYHAAVMNKIQQYWVLPEFQEWDTSLEAVLVVRIRRDGVVTKTFFEKKSTNTYFNEFVLKTMRLAEPMPPFPEQLKENFIEYGLRFHPGDLM